EEYRMVRGYPLRAEIGDMFWLAGLEYRLPLWRIERGFGTVPAFFRYLAGVAFVDAGNAFTRVATLGDAFESPLVGAGVELRLTGIYAWSTPLTGRIGYGVGLTGDGVGPTDPRALYLQFGGSF